MVAPPVKAYFPTQPGQQPTLADMVRMQSDMRASVDSIVYALRHDSSLPQHALASSSVHGFDASGNAPAQTHGSSRHTGTIGAWSQISGPTLAAEQARYLFADYATGTIGWKRPNNWINVQDIGAKGDGVTDDTWLISVGLAASKTENIPLYFPPGNYLSSLPLEYDSTVNIIGASHLGEGRSCLIYTGEGSAIRVHNNSVTCFGVCIRDLAVISASGEGAIGIELNDVSEYALLNVLAGQSGQGFATGISLINCHVGRTFGLMSQYNGVGLYGHEFYSTPLLAPEFSYNATAIQLGKCKAIQISDGYFEHQDYCVKFQGPNTETISAESVWIHDNYFVFVDPAEYTNQKVIQVVAPADYAFLGRDIRFHLNTVALGSTEPVAYPIDINLNGVNDVCKLRLESNLFKGATDGIYSTDHAGCEIRDLFNESFDETDTMHTDHHNGGLGTVISLKHVGATLKVSGPIDVASVVTEAVRKIGAVGQPTFENDWDNYGTWETAGFYKDATGRVYIEGFITYGTDNSTIFTLPTGYRPAVVRMFDTIQSPQSVCRIEVAADGKVNWVGTGAAGTWISLEGISFRAAT